MKQKLQALGNVLTKEQQRGIKGGLPYNCWCIFVSQAGPCWHIYWNKPCGVQPGQYVICDEGGCPPGPPVFAD